MSFVARLTDRAHVYARSAGQEQWRRVSAEPVACHVVALGPAAREGAWAQLEVQSTHRARALPSAHLQVGRKLVVVSGPMSGRSFVVLRMRRVNHPSPAGHVVLDLAQVEDEGG